MTRVHLRRRVHHQRKPERRETVGRERHDCSVSMVRCCSTFSPSDCCCTPACWQRPPVGDQSLARHCSRLPLPMSSGLWPAPFVLLLFWVDFAAVARFLVIAVALVVEVFATLQFRAAGRIHDARLQTA